MLYKEIFANEQSGNSKKVIDALGGRENVNSVAHCATRLRVMVKDEEKINKEVIENLEKVQGAFFNSGQYQIIFGTGTVNKMYDEVVVLGLPTSSKDDMKAEVAKQGNWFQRAIRTFGDVFVPIIPVIVATGLFMGVRGLFNALEMPLPGDFATYTQILTDTAFIILPGLVVWSTFRVFGGNPAVGIVLGMMLVSGSLPNAWAVAQGGEVTAMNFFGFIPVVGLQGSVLPAFIIGVVGAKFEKAVRKVVPDVIDLLVTPFVTLLVMSILGLAGTGNGITIIPGTMLYVGNGQLPQYLLMVAVSFALGFALTYMFGYEDEVDATAAAKQAEVAEEKEEVAPAALQNETLVTPIVGDVVALADVNDPVFSSGAMGQGIAVKPSQGVVYAPADAEVSIAFPTGHAFGLKTRNGAEVLIHVGIDTVSMNGDGFEAKVAQGNKVKAGDVLGTFDSNKIAAAGLDDTTMVIVTNTADYASVAPVATGSVSKGDAVIEVKI
ncbi:PTS system [Streptococcus pneumoniae]|nr:PTS system [Streptococcus pneumoniae]COB80821.1 PTS system [Streptococcus pneumoniae]